MSDSQQNAFDTFFRHLVGLRVEFLDPQGIKRSRIFSSFLFHHRGRAFLITAGHIFDEAISQALSSPPEAQVSFFLVDHFLSTAKFKHHIPFERTLLEHAHFSTRPDLYDFAFIQITENYSNLLTNNGLCHLDQSYFPAEGESFEASLICGLPDELNDTSKDGQTGKVGFAVKFINPGERPRLTQVDYPEDTFFANVVMDEKFKSLEGMSGGPIFGILKNGDGKQEYRLRAVQAGWIGKSTVVGCSPRAFLYHVDKYCDEIELKKGAD